MNGREGILSQALMVLTAFLAITMVGCTPANSPSSSAGGGKAKLSLSVKTGTQTTSIARSAYLGTSAKNDIVSLKYAISDITMYTDSSIIGSGFQGTGTSLNLYHNERLISGATGNMTLTDAATDTQDFTDLMSPADLQKLSAPITIDSTKIGVYKYIQISTYPIVKLTAKVTLNDSTPTVLYTRPVDPSTPENTNNTYTPDLVDTTSRALAHPTVALTPEESIFRQGAGAYFVLESPLTISQADLDSQTSFSVVMTFNPEGFVQASNMATTPAGGNPGAYQIRDNTWGIIIPPISLGAVAVKSGASVTRETYLVTMTVTDQAVPTPNTYNYLARLALYYDTSDSTKGIKGLDLALLPDYMAGHLTQNIVPNSNIWTIYSVTKATDGSYAFNLFNGYPFFSGLVRGAPGNVQYDNSAANRTASNPSVFTTLPFTYLGTDAIQ